ncbi:MAG: septal ring lytic transglycosylase RlpA family protein [Hyphomicrobium sp.]
MSRFLTGARGSRSAFVASIAVLLSGCSQGSDTPRSSVSRPLFTESEYGVRSSPRVTTYQGALPKGGGSYKLGSPYAVAGQWYVPHEDPRYDRQGVGSWYGEDFHGRKTANGELFDKNALTAAHPTLPLPSYAYVTNLQNGRTVLVRVNDRGPYVGGRIIDLSHASARALGYDAQGRARVRVRYAGRAPISGDDRRERQFLAEQRVRAGRSLPMAAALPRYAPPGAQQSLPWDVTTKDRWSPTTYRSALAGK